MPPITSERNSLAMEDLPSEVLISFLDQACAYFNSDNTAAVYLKNVSTNDLFFTAVKKDTFLVISSPSGIDTPDGSVNRLIGKRIAGCCSKILGRKVYWVQDLPHIKHKK